MLRTAFYASYKLFKPRLTIKTFPIEGLAHDNGSTLVCAGLEIREYGRGDPLR
jgi:hypothetical protein